jgi:hypothetical protein
MLFTCKTCNKNFKPGRVGRKPTYCSKTCYNLDKQRKPNICLCCGKTTLNPKYCDHSCAAKINNKIIGRKHGPIAKPKISKKTKTKTIQPRQYEGIFSQFLITGPYSIIFLNTCAKTGIKTYQKYHISAFHAKKQYEIKCKFKFSISQFPLWFDGSLIEQFGWYSTPGSKKGIKNINGVSRDHLISVNYGYLNNVDSYYISHPANCRLVRHEENNKKNTKCKITFEELLLKIKEFEMLYPNWHESRAVLPLSTSTHPNKT